MFNYTLNRVIKTLKTFVIFLQWRICVNKTLRHFSAITLSFSYWSRAVMEPSKAEAEVIQCMSRHPYSDKPRPSAWGLARSLAMCLCVSTNSQSQCRRGGAYRNTVCETKNPSVVVSIRRKCQQSKLTNKVRLVFCFKSNFR